MSADTGHLYSSTQLLTATGCTRKALRVYQEKGLIRTRVDHGKRRYGAEAFDRLRLIVGLRELGMSIANIGSILRARDGDAAVAGPVAAELATQVGNVIGEISTRIEDLIRLRDAMKKARATLVACTSCGQPPTDCVHCAEQGALDSVTKVLLVESKLNGTSLPSVDG